MRVAVLLIIFLGCLHTESSGQTLLTKQEILDSWTTRHKLESALENGIFPLCFDSILNLRANVLLSKLKTQGVDTLMIYSRSYPGIISLDTCTGQNFPEELYFLWPGEERINVAWLNGFCDMKFYEVGSDVFDFWLKYAGVIEREEIMPVLLNATRDDENRISYKYQLKGHDIHYQVTFIAWQKILTFRFQRDQMENRSNIFYNENLSSKTFELWKKLEGLIY